MIEQIKHKLIWDKVPSVTCGGADYFYNTWLGDKLTSKKITVIFNRDSKKWDIKTNFRYDANKNQYIEDTIGENFASANKAIAYFESLDIVKIF